MSIESFASLQDGAYTARFMDGRLIQLTMPGKFRSEHLVALLNKALAGHDADSLAMLAPEAGRAEREVQDFADRALQRAQREIDASPSLAGQVRAALAGAPRLVGRSRSGNVELTVVGGEITDIQLSATLRTQGQRTITDEVDEALAEVWHHPETQAQMDQYSTSFTAEAVADATEAALNAILRGQER